MDKAALIGLEPTRRFYRSAGKRHPATEALEGRTLMSDVMGAGGIITENSVHPLFRSSVTVLSQPVVNPTDGTFSLTVGVENSIGNLVPNDSKTGQALAAEIAIASGPGGAVLSGAVQASINSDGTMTFSGLAVNIPGAYTFNIIDATPLASTVTASINLPAATATSVAGPSDDVHAVTNAPGQIVVLNQPQIDSSNGRFSVTIQLKDANGNPITSSAANPLGEAEIEIASGPTGFAVLHGNTADSDPNSMTIGYAEAVVNPDGTATFSGLTISTAGTYSFKVSDASPSASVITSSVDLTPPPQGPVGVLYYVPITNFQFPNIVTAVDSTTPSSIANQAPVTPPLIAAPTLTLKQLRAELKAEKIAGAKQIKAANIAAARELKVERRENLTALRAARKAAANAAKTSAAKLGLISTPLG